MFDFTEPKINDQILLKQNVLLENIKLDIVRPRSLDTNVVGTLNTAYSFWKSIWQKTYALELKVSKSVRSDDFLFNEEVGVLSCNEEVVGLIFFNWILSSNCSHLDHSYFLNYPEEVVSQLRSGEESSVMIMSNLSISEKWRKSYTFVSISEILVGLATYRFSNSNSSKLISFTRNSRKMNQVVYKFGAVPLKKNHGTAFDSDVDVIAIHEKNQHTQDLKLNKCIQTIWRKYENRLHFSKRNEEVRQTDSILSVG